MKNEPVEYYIPPVWCMMSLPEHFDGMGGCWGVSGGYVNNQGEEYCKDCEYHDAEKGPIRLMAERSKERSDEK